VSFTNNAAYWVGAIYAINGTTLTFSGKDTLFEGNQALDTVGAVMIRSGSRAVFSGENTVFRNNFMTNNRYGTGAIDVSYNSSADFTATNLVAQSNNAGSGTPGGWGGFMWSDSSTVLFGNVLIGGETSPEGNVAYYGGGIYAGNNDIMTFSGAKTVFGNNYSYVDGGGMYITSGSTVTFNTGTSTTSFQNNTARNKGGAAAVNNSSLLSFQGKGAIFDGNSAVFGGAVSVETGSTLSVVNGNFTRNHAASAGGAVYLRGNSAQVAVLRSNTTTAGTGMTVFRGNTARGISNALYLDDYSSAYFNTAAGTSVEMFDGITGSTNTSTTYFEVSGAGNFNMRGTFDTINLTSTGRFNLLEGSLMNAGTVNNSGRFSMQNGVGDKAYMKALNNSGMLAMDIIGAIGNLNDQIIVSGNLALNAGSTMELKADSITDTNFRKKIYKLINYETYTGTFTAVSVLAPVPLTNNSVGYGDAYANWVTLSIRGSLASTDFSNKGLDTFNQKEAAKALDEISKTVVDNSPWDLALADIEAYDNNGIKSILSHLAGFFLPNVIRNAAADSPNNEIYDRIKNHCIESHSISNGLWVQAKAGVESFYENENSIGDYKDTSAGIMAGYDRFMADRNLMLGIYGRFNSDSIEQGKNKADGRKNGLGVYGGYIKEGWELKALTLGSFDSFETKRYIPYNNATAETEIKTTTLNLDFEGALKFAMTDNTKFRPYAGLELENANYGSFKESGAGLYNLDVDGGNYLRTAGRVGAGFQYEEEVWSWYANLEGKYLFSGTEPEIDNVFEGTSASFKTRGAKEGALELGAGAGASVRLTKELKLFANANYYGADKYQNIYGNIGLRYTFCKTFSLKDYTPLPEPVTYEEPVKAAPEPAIRQKSEDINMFDEKVVEEQKLEAQKRREKPMLKSYSLNMASFDVNKADLKPQAKKDIAREAEEIKQFNYKRIIIEGHTDSTGGDRLNKELSKARAKSVHDEFLNHGIPEEKMVYIGFGPSMPRDTNKTSEGRANNRRVEIFVE
jgi:outer membrane protein OmpA-like peptidoglycan-associated protein